MSAEDPNIAGADMGAAGAPGQPSEEELRAAYEAELSRVTSTDIIAQTVVSLINVGARRLGLTGDPQAAPAGPERDLAQVRDAIDGARALIAILERSIPQELTPLRDALSRLQMAYAREAQANPGEPQPQAPGAPGEQPSADTAPAPGAPGGEQAPAAGEGPGPAEASGRLWVPGR